MTSVLMLTVRHKCGAAAGLLLRAFAPLRQYSEDVRTRELL